MKSTTIRIYAVFIFLSILFSSCNVLVFSGMNRVRFHNDVAYQTVKWEAFSNEEAVRQEFTDFLRETLRKAQYKDYALLFQSNYDLEVRERTYVIKIFRNREDKRAYFNKTDDLIYRTSVLDKSDFDNRWQQLRKQMLVEDVYDLLPELADLHAQQALFTNRSELRLANYWLTFDLKGFLLDFGKGTMPHSSSKSSEDWVF